MKIARKASLQILAVFLLSFGCSGFAAHKPKNDECLACHSDATLTKEVNGKQASLFVDESKLKHSVHGNLFTCVDCHTDVKDLAHHHAAPRKLPARNAMPIRRRPSPHSYRAKQSPQQAARLLIALIATEARMKFWGADDPKSPVNHANIPDHLWEMPRAKVSDGIERGKRADLSLSYQESVHGLAIEKGSKKAAVCTDCHGSHEILAANDSRSSIYKFNVPADLRQVPYAVAQTFMQSIHGQGNRSGNGLAPVCTDCHGIHSIKAHIDPDRRSPSRTWREPPARAAMKVCACHRSSASPETAFQLILTAIMGWLLKAARWLWPTAPVATACTTFCHRAIPTPPSIAPTST